MKKCRKLIAGILVSSMLFGAMFVSGCKKKKDGTVISEDDPWFNVEKIDISDSYYKSGTKYEYLYFNYLFTSGDSYVVNVGGSKPVPDDFDWEKDDYSQYSINDLAVYSNTGDLTKKINLNDFVQGDNEYIGDFEADGDNVKAKIYVYDEKTWDEEIYETTINLKDGKASKRVKLEGYAGYDANYSDGLSFEGTATVGDYTVAKYYMSDGDKPSYTLEISDKSGNVKKINMKKEFSDVVIWNIDNIVVKDSTTCWVMCSCEEGSGIFTLDVAKAKMTQEKDTEWLDGIDAYRLTPLNETLYSFNEESLSSIDFDNKEVNEVLNFNDCNLDRSNLSNFTLIDAEDGKYTFFAETDSYHPYSESETQTEIVILSKADKNPHAGKTIITLCNLGGSTSAVSASVCEYNDTSKDYFIKYENKYSYDDLIDYSQEYDETEWNNMIMKAQAEMSNQLSIDLMNGDGPDIIIGGFSYGQLNNSDYLADLSSYMDKLGSEGYFSNVIDGAKVDGKLYQIPTSFMVSGIITDKDNVKKGQVGFTFDEYKTFVDKVCNGKDPIYEGQVPYFITCATAMSDLFIDGNKASYNNKAFQELADYVKNNVPEVFEWDDEVIEGGFYEEWTPDPATFSSFSGFSGYLDNYNTEKGPDSQIVLGLPSYDGRGPQITIYDSVGISAQCVDTDACWAFVEILLGEEIQNIFAYDWGFPVNVKSYETTSESMIEYYNKSLSDPNMSWSGMPQRSAKLDKSLVKDFETECIMTAHVSISDPSIMVIVAEEIPAYFSGQKKIDQVTDVLENRVNTVLSERG